MAGTMPPLRDHLSQLRSEDIIFERLIYKNKSQHRRTLHFRKLQEVRKLLKFLRTAASDKLLAEVDFHLKPTNSARKFTGKSTKAGLTKRKQAVLNSLWGVSRILHELNVPILRASKQFAGLLEQGFFLSFALVVLSVLARIRVLSFQLFLDTVSIYNFLATNVHDGNSLEPFSKLQQELPTRLECKWDPVGAQYTLQEIKANTESWFKDDRSSKKKPGQPGTLPVDNEAPLTSPQARSQTAIEFLKFLEKPDPMETVAYVSVPKLDSRPSMDIKEKSPTTSLKKDALFELLSGKSSESIF